MKVIKALNMIVITIVIMKMKKMQILKVSKKILNKTLNLKRINQMNPNINIKIFIFME